MTMTQPPECPDHGPMTPGETTPGGTWFDCPPGPVGETCRSAALIPSPELKELQESLPTES